VWKIVKDWNLMNIADRNVKWHAHSGKQYGTLIKLNFSYKLFSIQAFTLEKIWYMFVVANIWKYPKVKK
jgi:hypothetical protein